jgi:cytochrome P450
MYEVLRWHVALPVGIPRSTAKADTYRGFRIPEGTTILPNIWQVQLPLGMP